MSRDQRAKKLSERVRNRVDYAESTFMRTLLNSIADEIAELEYNHNFALRYIKSQSDGCVDTGARATADANARSISEMHHKLSTLEGRVNVNRERLIAVEARAERIKAALCDE